VIQFLKVTGESLSPFFLDGDYVLLGKSPFFLRRLRPGDFVVFRHPVYGVMIKQVEFLSPDRQELTVLGTHPDSKDSRQYGPIPRLWLTGKVIWRVRRP